MVPLWRGGTGRIQRAISTVPGRGWANTQFSREEFEKTVAEMRKSDRERGRERERGRRRRFWGKKEVHVLTPWGDESCDLSVQNELPGHVEEREM